MMSARVGCVDLLQGSVKPVAFRVDDYKQFPPTPGVQHFPLDLWHICT
jgi:hypothetical protein